MTGSHGQVAGIAVTSTAYADIADVVVRPWFTGERPTTFALRRGFTGQAGQVLAEPAEDGDGVALMVGLGPRDRVTPLEFRRAAAAAVRTAGPARSMRIDLAEAENVPVPADQRARAVTEGAVLACYGYRKYRSTPVPPLRSVAVRTGRSDAVAEATAVASGVCLCRDLVNAPAGELTPTGFAERVADLLGDSVTVHKGQMLTKLGMEGILSVARGSHELPCLVEINHTPARAERSVTLVGLGITFDSGGLALKTAEDMRSMKSDMAGAAAVVGAMYAAKALGIQVQIRALLPLAENMPGGGAVRTGDIVRHADGSTTEVLNPDNEGRLVLADALLWAADGPTDAVVDVATLTSAVAHALGTRTAALFSPDDALAADLLAAADRAGELVWRLPIAEAERRHLRSAVADRRNCSFRPGDAVHAALFLGGFARSSVPWAHLDLGAAAFNEEGPFDEIPHGGTGFAVRTLVDFLRPAADRVAGTS